MSDSTRDPPQPTEPGAILTGRASPRAVLFAVGFSVFVAADDLTVVSTMLRPIIGDLGVQLPDGLDDAAWVVNAYLIAFIAVMPIAGRLSDVIGRRGTFVLAYAIFIVGTIWIPLSSSLGPFLVGRVLTAIGGGAMVPVALAVVGDVYREPRRARALGTLGAIETMGWVWGPIYGAALVRFFDWRLQFWLNVPLGLVGLAAVWWALADLDGRARAHRIDWVGALLLTTALVCLNLALLGSAEVQSVQGLDQLTGNGGTDLRMLYPVALVTGVLFVWQQRRSADPLIDRAMFRSTTSSTRLVTAALIVNLVIGAALVIAMVDVPLFVNAIEVDLERSAVTSGWVLSALTASMAVASYLGGRLTERVSYRLPVLVGVALSAVGFGLMGATWSADSNYAMLAVQLALLGVGFGLTTAPTTSAVVDTARPLHRGSAAALVMVVRLLGLSIGLSALTAWGLARFNSLRGSIELPPLDDPGFGDALREASAHLTSSSIAQTFSATAVVLGIGWAIAALLLKRANQPPPSSTTTPSTSEHSMNTVNSNDPANTLQRRNDEGGAAMVQRHLVLIVAALSIALIIAFAMIAVLFAKVSATSSELDDANAALMASADDLARVEAGAALFGSQVTGFQEEIANLSPTIRTGLDDAVTGLAEFGDSTLEFNVDIDENVNVATDVVIDRVIEVPIQATLPIDEELDTTITVNGPFNTEIPLDITVPIKLDLPIDLNVDIPINEQIPISADVPVEVQVPIKVNIADTQLAELAASLASGLESFAEVLDELGG